MEMMMMQMYFEAGSEVTILFKPWKISTWWGLMRTLMNMQAAIFDSYSADVID